jgi:hypothetical protein
MKLFNSQLPKYLVLLVVALILNAGTVAAADNLLVSGSIVSKSGICSRLASAVGFENTKFEVVRGVRDRFGTVSLDPSLDLARYLGKRVEILKFHDYTNTAETMRVGRRVIFTDADGLPHVAYSHVQLKNPTKAREAGLIVESGRGSYSLLRYDGTMVTLQNLISDYWSTVLLFNVVK